MWWVTHRPTCEGAKERGWGVRSLARLHPPWCPCIPPPPSPLPHVHERHRYLQPLLTAYPSWHLPYPPKPTNPHPLPGPLALCLRLAQARRRKMVVEQQAGAAAAEQRAQPEALLAALQRQSSEEQRLAARLWQVGGLCSGQYCTAPPGGPHVHYCSVPLCTACFAALAWLCVVSGDRQCMLRPVNCSGPNGAGGPGEGGHARESGAAGAAVRGAARQGLGGHAEEGDGAAQVGGWGARGVGELAGRRGGVQRADPWQEVWYMRPEGGGRHT